MAREDLIFWIIIIIPVLFMGYNLFTSNENKDVSRAEIFTSKENKDVSYAQFNPSSEIKPPTQKSISLRFYNTKYNCTLNGEAYLDEYLLGNTSNGKVILNEGDYKNYTYSNSTIFLQGITDSCFIKDSNLPVFEIWDLPDLTYYFENSQDYELSTNSNPRLPKNYGAAMGFIRPEETREYIALVKPTFNNDTEHDIDILANFYMQYDYSQMLSNYHWQTPAETLKTGRGDCKAWAITFLSLVKEYNSSLECYGLMWSGHINVFCYLDHYYYLYDQEKIKLRTALTKDQSDNQLAIEQENKIKLRQMLNNYFDQFGLDINEAVIEAMFNSSEVIKFNSNEDFVNFMYDLRNH